MSFLGKLFGKRDSFALEDEPMTGYDPLASERKVNNFLGNTDSSDDGFNSQNNFNNLNMNQQSNPYSDSFSNQNNTDGLPPNPYETDNNYSNFSNQNNSTLSNGMSAQQMADRYIKQQEQSQTNMQRHYERDEEVLNLKLESMKNQLETINQRLQRIEQLIQSTNRKW